MSSTFEPATDSPLPVPGVQYFLQHVQSGKYVHPHGGSDMPGNDTALVLHHGFDEKRDALRWVFVNDAENKHQLKHYSSGKFVHPKGGKVGKEATLVVHSSPGRPETMIEMVQEDGRTYLRHTDSDYYVHPHGGSPNPGDNTRLVYYSGYRPSLAFLAIPAETLFVDRIEIHQAQALESINTITSLSDEHRNDTDQPVQTSISVALEESLQDSAQLSFERCFGLKVGSEFEVGLPLVGKTKVSVQFSGSWKSSTIKGEVRTSAVKVQINEHVTIPPGKCVQIRIDTRRCTKTAPATMYLRTASGIEVQRETTVTSTYHYDQEVHVVPVTN
ncbi:hypothetical protein PTSG_08235 [Salpingoeca rosetta]|uniref:Uncharacterized protein n=1 Tax=Salpingoeca rosetta (strain ATCC 50818 / BSB-021) TaxID=946362 RepID=F2UID9_SALR5|nr:uncharacterized protein PTSG_08235 [Salpingoeca rosetta]EGD76888.1 hypothetical protein PTSG_08235 [Salpingoeca rosetta]7R55_A Chain A, Sarol-1 [Salpingoeca rosetta]7R55_B Chain B, Sarol-1 [Salpingoeca rosetta]|eukprot:XP_004991260.1 hypothetical protein PTSG_08235 [Salpingoeca rosetta]